MLIDYQCPRCGRTGQALAHLVGKSIRCPSCAESIRLPGGEVFASGVAPQRPAFPSADESPEAAAREASELQHGMLEEMQRQGRQLEKISNNVGCIFIILAIWFFVGIFWFLVGLAVNGWFWWRWTN